MTFCAWDLQKVRFNWMFDGYWQNPLYLFYIVEYCIGKGNCHTKGSRPTWSAQIGPFARFKGTQFEAGSADSGKAFEDWARRIEPLPPASRWRIVVTSEPNTELCTSATEAFTHISTLRTASQNTCVSCVFLWRCCENCHTCMPKAVVLW